MISLLALRWQPTERHQNIFLTARFFLDFGGEFAIIKTRRTLGVAFWRRSNRDVELETRLIIPAPFYLTKRLPNHA